VLFRGWSEILASAFPSESTSLVTTLIFGPPFGGAITCGAVAVENPAMPTVLMAPEMREIIGALIVLDTVTSLDKREITNRRLKGASCANRRT
jgi:hypothetical protein